MYFLDFTPKEFFLVHTSTDKRDHSNEFVNIRVKTILPHILRRKPIFSLIKLCEDVK